ncbi:PilZ domain-containing protein [Novosphingobium album (ex Liu et al. 2023)]|uniref:PilZ domain-containing protein n=1 Tax=Novosphingobium album (ex Liu et al. 2023) TaxID=3031130 RepID=A0ABT5WQP6_9SPHN|nr:PilZ domain-containing protein [Novosphingobium album (ex Liu et al. 2023)]MDE8652371.1 PilZ domain-containing protein [Novosphingobium album (ex Liu et al. 2023)]
MDQAVSETIVCGRRSYSRLRVRLPAKLVLLHGESKAILEDLSFEGARLRIGAPVRIGEDALLLWKDFEAFGRVIWQNGARCGLRFDARLKPAVLIATRDCDDAEHLGSDRELLREVAQAWVRGSTRL